NGRGSSTPVPFARSGTSTSRATASGTTSCGTCSCSRHGWNGNERVGAGAHVARGLDESPDSRSGGYGRGRLTGGSSGITREGPGGRVPLRNWGRARCVPDRTVAAGFRDYRRRQFAELGIRTDLHRAQRTGGGGQRRP